MPRTVATQLMFDGSAEEALTFYRSVFQDLQTGKIERFGPGEGPPVGTLNTTALN